MKIILCCPIYEIYGLTESTGMSFCTKKIDNILGHVGGPSANVEFKLVDVPEMNYFTKFRNI